ncbi:MAG: acyltransferase [Methanosarcinales archaeon]|nr:acyltransferase [Methanosarcinales archaeon]
MKLKTNYLNRLTTSVFFNSISLRLFKILIILFEKLKKSILINQLESCGKGFSMQFPIEISGTENLEIGDNVSIASFVHIWGGGGVKIGNRVMIGSHVAITSLTHDYNKRIMFNTLKKGKIIIEDDVWIGTHSVILPGVLIGKGAVVGAGSIVTKDVKPYSIVLGVPAKHFKFRNTIEVKDINQR